MNDFGLALQSGAILLREGLEAMLIVTALAAALRRGGSRWMCPISVIRFAMRLSTRCSAIFPVRLID
jgi:high-affinity Fe2+/Pb2+ permease